MLHAQIFWEIWVKIVEKIVLNNFSKHLYTKYFLFMLPIGSYNSTYETLSLLTIRPTGSFPYFMEWRLFHQIPNSRELVWAFILYSLPALGWQSEFGILIYLGHFRKIHVLLERIKVSFNKQNAFLKRDAPGLKMQMRQSGFLKGGAKFRTDSVR